MGRLAQPRGKGKAFSDPEVRAKLSRLRGAPHGCAALTADVVTGECSAAPPGRQATFHQYRWPRPDGRGCQIAAIQG
ncbi:hypothetical protein MPLA_940016 [Mesorhizobium sp. ORS 3359]|nr:hypothetical protein MPLA_940016 [Mesorhizobium sp. ORS 3359]